MNGKKEKYRMLKTERERREGEREQEKRRNGKKRKLE
jgi:hypothetical protein